VPRDLPRGEVPDAVTPPLGCPFHPRCPQAFEVCGWEARDLRTLLEARWTGLSQEGFEAERAVIADIDSLNAPSTTARLAAASGHSGEDVDRVLERLRADAPDDPFWKGVAEKRVEGDAVVVRFHEGIVPREVEAGSSTVRCHLHDEQALEQARRIRGG
jgi:peptide/nickel transport system ATP-binding protein